MSQVGSPPRVRGKGGAASTSWICSGITPAYAGKSWLPSRGLLADQDHPRVCGEKPLQSSVNCTMEGSPPRMRGKVVLSSENPLCRGITPAYAGKRFRWRATRQCEQDHPRVCGEKCIVHVLVSEELGITPACAGKRMPRVYGPSVPGDHPRVCGEKYDAPP